MEIRLALNLLKSVRQELLLLRALCDCFFLPRLLSLFVAIVFCRRHKTVIRFSIYETTGVVYISETKRRFHHE